MTKLEMFEFIDEFLSQQEDLLHGIEGENCTKSRKYLEMLKEQLALCNVSHCACTPDETTGTTTVRCCNICGKPTESFWRCG